MHRRIRSLVSAGLVVLLGGLAPSALAAKNVLRLMFNGPIAEAPPAEGELALLFGGQKMITLRDLVEKLDKAAKDPEIAGIAMIIESPSFNRAQLEEITRSLNKFRAADKRIYCYMDEAGSGAYALACAADFIMLPEYSQLNIFGICAQASYYKGLLEKLGVQADMLHCGAYKSALEPFTRTEPSKEAAENVNWLLDGIYDRWVHLVASGRKLSPEQVKAAVDQAPVMVDDALKLKLIDAIGSFDDFTTELRKQYGKDVELVKKYPREDSLDVELDPSNPFAMFTQMNEVMKKLFGGEDEEAEKPGIGIVYVDGGIVMGKSGGPGLMGGGGNAGCVTIRAALDAALEDANVKAIVLRVDSPGGSALASDIMWKAAARAAKEKPLIVSMGGVAGSGGYYVSLPGETVFAEECTITGSIGVVGGKLVWNGLWEGKLGVTTTEYCRGKNAALFSMNHPWTEDERASMQNMLNTIYEQFKGRVMQSRGGKIKGNLEDLAGGRVYTGRQALEHGLVDQIGGLSDALAYAAKKVDLTDYAVHVYPKPKELMDVLKEMMGEETHDEWEVSAAPLFGSDPFSRALLSLVHGLAPEQVQRLAAGLRDLVTLNTEHVGCFMPFYLSMD